MACRGQPTLQARLWRRWLAMHEAVGLAHKRHAVMHGGRERPQKRIANRVTGPRGGVPEAVAGVEHGKSLMMYEAVHLRLYS